MATHYDQQRHHRRSIRLRGYDYTATGTYYLTLCSFQYQHVFGRVVNEEMILSDTGNIVEACWLAIPEHFPGVSLDEWVIMSNHIHGIILIGEEDEQFRAAYDARDEESMAAQVQATHDAGDGESMAALVRAQHAAPVLTPGTLPTSWTSASFTWSDRQVI
ncbi:MAG: transposase [Anaerolineae bacterium]